MSHKISVNPGKADKMMVGEREDRQWKEKERRETKHSVVKVGLKNEETGVL